MEENVTSENGEQPVSKDEVVYNFEEIEAEKVEAHYFNGSLITPTMDLYRINSVKGRTYFKFRDPEHFRDPILYFGTSSITAQMPTPRALIRYKAEKGWSATEKEYHMWSFYGSFSDSRIAEFIKNGRFSEGLEGLSAHLRDYLYNQRFWVSEEEFSMLSKCIKKDMVGVEKFIYDRKAEFVFIEYPVASDIDGTATQIDFGCFFDREVNKDATNPKKGKAIERTFGLFNYKSGKIYAPHGIQCMAERNMFMETHPEFTTLPIRSFNLTIRDFKTMNNKYRPTSDYGKPYQIKDWTDDANYDDFRDYLSLAQRKRKKQLEHKISTIQGDMKLGDDPIQYIVTKTIQEIIEDGSWRRYQKTNAGVPDEFLEVE